MWLNALPKASFTSTVPAGTIESLSDVVVILSELCLRVGETIPGKKRQSQKQSPNNPCLTKSPNESLQIEPKQELVC